MPILDGNLVMIKNILGYRDMFSENFRFSVEGLYDHLKFPNIKCCIKTSMLSLGTLYTARLVFKFKIQNPIPMKMTKIKWKTKQLSVCSTHDAVLTHGDWYSIKMWHFINTNPESDFDIVLEELSYPQPRFSSHGLIIQGFEIKPTEMNGDIKGCESLLMTIEEVDMNNDRQEYWAEKLPDDYISFVQMLNQPRRFATKKMVYLGLCQGFLGRTQMWFSLCKSTLGMCSMLRPTDLIWDSVSTACIHTVSQSESRFQKVIKLTGSRYYTLKCRLWYPMFTAHYIYACYLVFKFLDNQPRTDTTVLFESSCWLDNIYQGLVSAHINLDPINIPTIKPTNDCGSHDSSNIPRNDREEMKKRYIALGWCKIEERKDGWMEVMLCKPLHHLQDHQLLDIKLSDNMYGILSEIIIEGVEFRPFIL